MFYACDRILGEVDLIPSQPESIKSMNQKKGATIAE